jgi:predicted XRE-type DNA-binding protein
MKAEEAARKARQLTRDLDTLMEHAADVGWQRHKLIRELIREHGWSQHRVAGELGISQARVSKIMEDV